MADRYDIYGVVKVSSLDDEWVNYRDYAKLDDLCGRMKTLLECVPDNGSMYAKICKQAIDEAKKVALK